MFNYLCLAAFILIFLKFSKNGLNWYKLYNFKKIYTQYCRYNSISKQEWDPLHTKVLEKNNDIIKLLKKSEIKDFIIQATTPTGHGFVTHNNISVLSNIDYIGWIGETNVPATIHKFLTQAIGFNKQRMIETFSPFYWINLFVFLPKNIFIYLELPYTSDRAKLLIKIFNIFYWFICSIGSIFFKLFDLKIIF
ncbi:hypothetical protein [Legionella drancourtii]|uniref:Uncharacterized protein n=1 Tax=Legionella drancourtii LLAP12 TaxID=658187 RepID=G9ELD6_9GAMM|nr:hypothetical protein [Legionella drancourtii]EHL31771.1 hypothetical protein LDG_5933 [Legionella drancourtii LLAP12]